jgi:Rad3-related DNA helicase
MILDEIEQMRADCERELRDAYAEYKERAEEQDAEIERLRKTIDDMETEQHESNNLQWREIERLREQVKRTTDNADVWEQAATKAEAEIGRMREALQRLIVSGQKAHDIGLRKTDIWDAFGRDLEFARTLKEK